MKVTILPTGYAWGYGHQGLWDDLAPNLKLIPNVAVPEKESITYRFEVDPIHGSRIIGEGV